MAWIDCTAQLPILLSSALAGALLMASCSSTPPAQSNCTYTETAQGTVVECPDGGSGGTSGTVTSGNGVGNNTTGGGGIPQVDATTSGTGGIPMVDASASSTTDGGVGTSSVTGSSVGGGSTVSTGATMTGGPSTTGTGTTGGGTSTLGTLTVNAGALNRDHSIVSFEFPQGQGKAMSLTDPQGTEIPLQYSSTTGKATFILPALAANESVVYTINELPQPMPVGISAVVQPDTTGDQLFLKQGDANIFRWTLVEDNFRGAAARDVRAGYIFPVWTPGGLNVADDYQVDHPHMHGIWSAWVETTFRGHKVDFWNGYANSGRVDLVDMEGIWSGPVTGGLIANLVHSDITVNPSAAALNEKWIVTVYKTHDAAPYYVYDVDSTQIAASSDPLILERYHYGGFGYRGSEDWQNPSEVEFLTSEGHTRDNGDGQRAKWVAQYGNINTPNGVARGGYAAFDHPTNYRHPQGLRIHPTNPYWAFVACTQLVGGRFEITNEAPYKSLYRIVAFDGDANKALLDQLWNDFATPPTVEYAP